MFVLVAQLLAGGDTLSARAETLLAHGNLPEARRIAEQPFALRPDYRDAWTVFESVYHDAGIWRRADAALAHHPDDPLALKRRAAIAIAVEAYGRADSLAALLLERRAPSVPAFLVRAEAQF